VEQAERSTRALFRYHPEPVYLSQVTDVERTMCGKTISSRETKHTIH
jgi:hypothetical protein